MVPQANLALKAAGDGHNHDEVDFKNMNLLGDGKVKDKRKNLEDFLTKLMSRDNKNLKKSHDEYCSKFSLILSFLLVLTYFVTNL